MKFFICSCLLVVVIGPSVHAKSFNFGNFFLGSSKKALDDTGSAVPPNLYESNPFEYSTEVDSDTYNTSSDDVFDYDNQNSSSDSLDGVSSRNESSVNASEVSSDSTAPPVAGHENNETISSNKSSETIGQSSETTTPAASTATSEKAEATTAAEVQPPSAKGSTPSTTEGEQEEVVLGTTTGATAVIIPTGNFFQKSIDWVKDAYTLSILIPVTAGVLFATTIILVIALCRCLRRCCRRRRFKRKPLPDSVKSLRPEDRARLLGDVTSDEEF